MDATIILGFPLGGKMNKKVVLLLVVFLIASCFTLSAVINYVDRLLTAETGVREKENNLATALVDGQKDFREIPYLSANLQTVAVPDDMDMNFIPSCSSVYFNYPGLSERNDGDPWEQDLELIRRMRVTLATEPEITYGSDNDVIYVFFNGQTRMDVFFKPVLWMSYYYFVNGECTIQ
jgi:hypothetical protein